VRLPRLHDNDFGKFKANLKRPDSKADWFYCTYEDDEPVGFVAWEWDPHHLPPDATPLDLQESWGNAWKSIEALVDTGAYLMWFRSPGDLHPNLGHIQGLYAIAKLPEDTHTPAQLRELLKKFNEYHWVEAEHCWDKRNRLFRLPFQRHMDPVRVDVETRTITLLAPELSDADCKSISKNQQPETVRKLIQFKTGALLWSKLPESTKLFTESLSEAPEPLPASARRPAKKQKGKTQRWTSPCPCQKRGPFVLRKGRRDNSVSFSSAIPSQDHLQEMHNTFDAAIASGEFHRVAWKYKGEMEKLPEAVAEVMITIPQIRPTDSNTCSHPSLLHSFAERITRWHFQNFDPSKVGDPVKRKAQREEDEQRLAYMKDVDIERLVNFVSNKVGSSYPVGSVTRSFRKDLRRFLQMLREYSGRVAYVAFEAFLGSREAVRAFRLHLGAHLVTLQEFSKREHLCRQYGIAKWVIPRLDDIAWVSGEIEKRTKDKKKKKHILNEQAKRAHLSVLLCHEPELEACETAPVEEIDEKMREPVEISGEMVRGELIGVG